MKRLRQRMAASRFNHGCDILISRSFDLSLFPSILLTFIGFWLYLIWLISRSFCLILFTVAHLEQRSPLATDRRLDHPPVPSVSTFLATVFVSSPAKGCS